MTKTTTPAGLDLTAPTAALLANYNAHAECMKHAGEIHLDVARTIQAEATAIASELNRRARDAGIAHGTAAGESDETDAEQALADCVERYGFGKFRAAFDVAFLDAFRAA